MPEALVPRFALHRLDLLVGALRIVIVNGPRQAGKTTLLAMLREQRGGSLRSLDNDQTLAAALADPREFARYGDRPIIIDEVQRGGDPLVLAIKYLVDQDNSPGHFVLSGSTRFLTIPTLSESLAGRAVFVDLWPLAVAERTGVTVDLAAVLFDSPQTLLEAAPSAWSREDYLRLLVEGGFPEAIRLPEAFRSAWFEGYLQTVIQRDVRQFADIRHAAVVPQLLRLLAARAGSPFVAADLARTVEMNQATIRDYLSYLNMVFLTIQIPAWSTSVTTKAAKVPKTFLADVGVAAHLLGADVESMREPGHKAAGVLLETFVVTELTKLLAHQDRGLVVHYFRDRDGREIDVVIEGRDGRVVAIEVKASASASSTDFRHLAWLRDKLGDRFVTGIVCNLGTESMSFGDRLLAVPVSTLWQHAPL
jgi:predicted AAA+ superfamily ATPase